MKKIILTLLLGILLSQSSVAKTSVESVVKASFQEVSTIEAKTIILTKKQFSQVQSKAKAAVRTKVYRYYDKNGMFYRDVIALDNENPEKIETIYHPVYPEKNTVVSKLKFERLLRPVVKSGIVVITKQSPIQSCGRKNGRDRTMVHPELISSSSSIPA